MTAPLTCAVLFPGQGSQVGNMRDTVALHAPELLDRCLELVGEDPFERVEDSTAFAQPAIFCASLASWMRVGGAVAPQAMAGHSLGELTSLAAAGALSPGDALGLVVVRGRLMAEAAALDPEGGMLAVLGGTPEDAERLAAAHGVTVANDNAPGQTVLSGPSAALSDAARDARETGLKAIALGVAGAFHSPTMATVADAFLAKLRTVDWQPTSVPVYSCVTARPFTDPAAELAAALSRPVRWRTTVAVLAATGVDTVLDVGPSRVLAKMVRRIDPELTVLSPADVVAEETRVA